MDRIVSIWKICLLGIRKQFVSYRTLLGLILSALIVVSSCSDLREFCAQVGVGATPLPLFIYLTSTNYTQRILLLCYIMILCDAPFLDDSQPYVLLRCGRYVWSAGQLLYILFSAIAYWTWIFLISIVVLYGHIVWAMDWGRVYYSLTQTTGLNYLLLSKALQIWASAPQAFFYSFLMATLLCVFFAQCMYFVNLTTSKNFGLLIPVAFILLHAQYDRWFLSPTVLYYSPVSLANLNYISGSSSSGFPSVGYAFIVLSSAVIVMTVLCILAIRRRTITIQKPI